MAAQRNFLGKFLALGLVLLAVGSSGCAICPWKVKGCGMGCGDVGCCDTACGCDMAFQKYKGCCKPHLPVCVCTGGDCCEPGCGCDVGCGCEPGCAAEPGCCAESTCGMDDCCEPCCSDCCRPCATCLYNVKYALGKLFGGLCGCSGCDGEIYWNEWHNDPPRCCDPCNKCGDWVGPSAGSYAPAGGCNCQ